MILGRLPSKHSEVVCHCVGSGRSERGREYREKLLGNAEGANGSEVLMVCMEEVKNTHYGHRSMVTNDRYAIPRHCVTMSCHDVSRC